MKSKTVVITGATSGLGRATALRLAKKGAFVVIVARNSTKANEIIEEIVKNGGEGKSIISDLTSMKDTRKAAESIYKVVDRLDVLINNAGAFFPSYRITSEGFESTLALNYLSPFLLTSHLIELMEKTASKYGEARIINISSIMHKSPINWDDLNYHQTAYKSTSAYYQSKHLLTSYTYCLSKMLEKKSITVNCIHPGFVKTALAQADYPFPMNIIVPIVGFFIGETPEHAADTPAWLALSKEPKSINGKYIHHREIKKSWPPTRDNNAQKRLFKTTQSMLSAWL